MTDYTPNSSRSKWTRAQAGRIERTESNVAPLIEPESPETDPADDVHVWDTWLLRDRDGEIATIDGWQVLCSLTASADLLPGKRHDVAEIRYFYSRDGRSWQDGGPVFADNALGQRQWAGSALYDDGDLYLYYTAAGEVGNGNEAAELTYTQRLAVGHGATLSASDDGVEIEGPWNHEILLEPDGNWYETETQSRGMIYTFRDPWFFEDPTSGETHLLFEANTPVPEGSEACDGLAEQQAFNGSVGIATSPTGDPLEWELNGPLLDAVCVNQELERPHVLYYEGSYYLFISSHAHTFGPGLEGYDALYGFVADSLRGEYRPLNESGLVVTNPATAPFQAYSWMVYAHREELLVESFANFLEFDSESLDGVADLPPAEQRRRFGGTLAPTIRLEVEGDRTAIRGTLSPWEIPRVDEALPEADGPVWEPTDPALSDRAESAARQRGYHDSPSET